MTDVHVEDHSTPIQTPKQLIVVVVLAFLIPILLIVMITQMVTGGLKVGNGGGGMSDPSTKLQPVPKPAKSSVHDARPWSSQASCPYVRTFVRKFL